MSLFVKCCSRHSWCKKDSCCQREKETSQSPARLHFTGFTSHSWKPAGRRSEQWRRRSEQWRTRQRQWAGRSWAQDRVCTQTQDSERANGWEDGWETCAATLLMYIKGLVHPKNDVMNYSLWCRSRPVRPLLIVRTQMKMFLFESEISQTLQRQQHNWNVSMSRK